MRTHLYTLPLRAVPQVGLLLALCQVFACGHQMVGWPVADSGDTAGDTTAPLVVSTTPRDAAVDVAPDAAIVATFNEAMDVLSLTPTALTLDNGSGPVPGVATPFGSAAIQFTPDDPLDREMNYTATVSTGVSDLAGNTLAAEYIWNFSTVPVGGDETPPRVIATIPSDLAVDVSLDVVVVATFNEAMDPATINAATVEALAPDASVVAGTVSYDVPGQSAVFTPDDDLLVASTYLLTVTSGASDVAGNGMAADYLWSFTTRDAGGDVTPPRVIFCDPVDLAVDRPLDTTMYATFNEAMDPATITGATFEAVAPDLSVVSGVVSYSVAGQTAALFPDADLAPGTAYSVTITTGATDLAGNGLASDYLWSFTTVPLSSDVTAPRVILTIPENLAVDEPVGVAVYATFSEAMDPLTITGATFEAVAPDLSVVSGVVSYSVAGQSAMLVPDADLANDTTYTVTITTGATDLAGNGLASDYVWSFTTAPLFSDVTAPRVILTVPEDLAVGEPLDVVVVATFNEAMDPATIDGATFEAVAPDLSVVSGLVSYSVAGQTASLVPDVDLDPDTTYTVTITTGATDLAGNGLTSDYVWSFTTTSLDAAPMVTLTDPADMAIAVPVATDVLAAFSEPMDPLTIGDATFDLLAPDLTEVTGVVLYDLASQTLTFTPDSSLDANTVYTATITTGVTDLAGNPMVADYTWSFTTEEAPWAMLPIDLGSLTTFVAVAGAGLTNSNSSGTTTLGGDVGLSPTGTCLGDGVPCTASNPVVTGTMYVADATAAQAKIDLVAAYVDGMSRPIGTTVNDISGMTLPAGVYTSSSTMSIAVGGTVILDGGGDENAVFIFQVGSSLTVNNNAQVLLINGAKAANVFWTVFASSTLGSDVRFQGSVLAGASNSVGTDSIVVGRLLCTTGQVTLLSNAITLPPS